MAFLLHRATAAAQSVQNTVANSAPLENVTSKLNLGGITNAVNDWMGKPDVSLKHRYASSAPISQGNNVSYHVSGCAYFWAISEALENVKESIWILGCMKQLPSSTTLTQINNTFSYE